MTCNKCGKENRPEAKYCRFCGEVLVIESTQKGLIGKDSLCSKLDDLDERLKVAGSIKGDNRFHRCQGTFTVPETVHDCGLYIYNRNTKDTVTVGDLSLVEILK